jgi:signal peptidase I
VLLGVIFPLVLPIGWRPFSVPSGSNIPTILIGDIFYADRTEAGRVPHRGEMMVLRYPRDRSISYIKRVIGLPGDHVQITGGQLYLNSVQVPRTPDGDYDATDVNGTRIVLQEYTETLPGALPHHILKFSDEVRFSLADQIDANNTPEYVVPEGHVFMLGDNRDNSSDSRFMSGLGYVPIDDLTGKATVIYFSIDPGTGTSAGRGSHWHIRWDRILHMVQ